MSFIDTHVHLWHDDYSGLLPAVVNRSIAAGVTRFVVPGIDLNTSKQAIDLAKEYKGIIPAIGLHPLNPEEPLEPFAELAALPMVKAIGEIGIDKRAGDFNQQEKRFRFFIELAIKVRKPILVHILHPWEPVLKKMIENPELVHKAVWHCFNADVVAAHAAREIGLLLSFNAIIARKKMEPTHEVITTWPLEMMMLETDGPWLSWPGVQGPNEPGTVIKVAERIAELKDIELEAVAETSTLIATNFFLL
jgi:TatD DNase family protein